MNVPQWVLKSRNPFILGQRSRSQRSVSDFRQNACYCCCICRPCWVFPAVMPRRTKNGSNTGFSMRHVPASVSRRGFKLHLWFQASIVWALTGSGWHCHLTHVVAVYCSLCSIMMKISTLLQSLETTVRRRSRWTFSTHFEIFRRRFDGVVIHFLNSDFKFFDDASAFSVTSFYVVFIFS